MTKHRSISQRLARAKSLDTKKEIALDWAKNWQHEQCKLITQLGMAVKNDDYDQLCIVTGQLKAVAEKRFSALPNVIANLSELRKPAIPVRV